MLIKNKKLLVALVLILTAVVLLFILFNISEEQYSAFRPNTEPNAPGPCRDDWDCTTGCCSSGSCRDTEYCGNTTDHLPWTQ